jgi:hypothetical protein
MTLKVRTPYQQKKMGKKGKKHGGKGGGKGGRGGGRGAGRNCAHNMNENVGMNNMENLSWSEWSTLAQKKISTRKFRDAFDCYSKAIHLCPLFSSTESLSSNSSSDNSSSLLLQTPFHTIFQNKLSGKEYPQTQEITSSEALNVIFLFINSMEVSFQLNEIKKGFVFLFILNSLSHSSFFILHSSFFILHSSFFILHSSFFILHSSFFILHYSFFILHSSFFILHSSFFILHSSFFILHSSFFILHSPFSILHSSFSFLISFYHHYRVLVLISSFSCPK